MSPRPFGSRHVAALFVFLLSFAGFAVPARAQTRFATVKSSKANIYQEPNENAPVKTKVRKGTYLEVGGVRGMWVRVRTDGGIVGYVLKTDVIPGKHDLGGGGEERGGGGGSGGGGGGGGGIGSGGPIPENRTGFLGKVGLTFAENAYKLSASGGFSRSVPMKTAYAGLNLDGSYFFLPSVGAHFRFLDTVGSMTATLGPPINKKVDRIPTNIERIELDLVGRYFFGDDPAAVSINGRLGFHIHQMLVDTVQANDGTPLFLVSQKYQGLVVGLGTDVPLGSPSFGLRGAFDFWLNPSLSEGKSGASGKAKGASGIDVDLGTYFNVSDSAGLDIGLEYVSFTGSFSGAGNRFNTSISNAKSADSYILFGVNGTFRF